MHLILGGSGFLGPALRAALAPSPVAATYCMHAFAGGLRFDGRRDSVRDLFGTLGARPRVGIILLGVTSIDACARDPAGSAQVNVEAIVRIIDELRALGILPVFASSDAVFDGSRALWREGDPARPILTYGHQKLAVERYLASLPPPWLAVRLPKLISSVPHPRCMVSDWVERLGKPGRILCATDQYFTPTGADDVARAIGALIGAGATGLYHLGGPQRLSRRQLLEAVVDEYARHAPVKAEIIDCSLRDIPVLEPRPLDVSMDSSLSGASLRPADEAAQAAVRRALGIYR